MKMTTKIDPELEELQQIPGMSQGVRENSAVRMLKLARPICPGSAHETEPDGRGGSRPVVNPTRINHQRLGGEWWLACIEAGEDPYSTTQTWTESRDIFDDNGEFVETKRVKHSRTIPNIASTPIGIRYNSGRGYERALAKGRKRLAEVGYAEVCQFRACQRPVSPKWRSERLGDFCSESHMGLIAADQQGVALTQRTEFGMGEESKLEARRRRQLKEALESAR
jgi:hypothetical protein